MKLRLVESLRELAGGLTEKRVNLYQIQDGDFISDLDLPPNLFAGRSSWGTAIFRRRFPWGTFEPVDVEVNHSLKGSEKIIFRIPREIDLPVNGGKITFRTLV